MGSPKNVTLNVLNGNSFFTFDYESTDPMNQTTQSFLGTEGSNQKHKNGKNNINLSLIKNSNVKSAQYSRKLVQNNLMNRSNINPYTRIRRVE